MKFAQTNKEFTGYSFIIFSASKTFNKVNGKRFWSMLSFSLPIKSQLWYLIMNRIWLQCRRKTNSSCKFSTWT